VEQPQAPLGVITAEWNLAPSFGGSLDLWRHCPRPASQDILVVSQHAGPRSRLFHNRP
jgi:hypothetical protein